MFDGVRRAAADNTLQITLDLEIKAQLTKYIEAQRQVLNIGFLGVYSRGGDVIAVSGSEAGSPKQQWGLSERGTASGRPGAWRRARPSEQLVSCNSTSSIWYRWRRCSALTTPTSATGRRSKIR